ncbi:MAG TPA: hypothetical protein PK228_14790 [Saprospiraceae bacterium]|nr:hypothetical protein [Saprospiraceae bacterium]
MKNTLSFRLLSLLVSCTLLTTTTSAQTINPEALSIDAKAIYTENGDVILRWAPSNYKTWLWGRDSGFVLQRITLEANDTILDIDDMNTSIVTTVLAPKSQSQWEAAMITDSVVGVAAGAYFGDYFTVVAPGEGGIVAAHNISSERDNRFGLSLFAADISTLAAEMQNMYFKDETVVPSHKYSYLIRPRGNTGSNMVRSGTASVKTTEPYEPPLPAEFSIIPGDSVAILTWNQAATGEHYSSYDVLRSSDGGQTFEKINDQPITPMDHPDGKPADQIIFYSELDDNTKQYQYKICGHSPFGFDGPATDPVDVQGVPKPLDASISVKEVNELPTGIEITWEFPAQLNSQIQGFNVLRALEHEGDYTVINAGMIGAAARKFTDASPRPSNYYKVEFIDLNNNKVVSIPKLAQPKDSIPPLAPGPVQGSAIGKDGVLKIHWSPSMSSDVMGYRVFMADQSDGNYGQITSKWTKDTVFYHKVNVHSLAEKKYFKVKAIDFRENNSDFSSMCVVDLPDIVPPSKPVMKKTEPKQNGVLVTFAPSTGKDVQTHQILRKKKDEVEWHEIATLDSLDQQKPVSYLDTTVQKMYAYDYMVQAVDDADQKSNSKVFPAKPVGNGIRETIQELEVRFVKSEGGIKLKWNYTNAFGVSGFVIYRGTEPDKLYEVGAVQPQQALKGGAYNGPNPFVTAQPGTGPAPPNSDHLATPGSFDLQQVGSPNTSHDTFYEYWDKEFLKFKPYYFAIGVRFEDGTSSPMSDVKSTSAY